MIPPGYKQTELGVIPDEWEVKPLEDVFALTSGFAFSSEFFSNIGPIVLTPGNFRLEGGLYFEDRNTKRYSGSYSPKMTFSRGDLLIVMTDLTPDCNLLGKPAFVESDEIILHNQRIGRVIFKNKVVEPQFLFYLLLSKLYLSRIKEKVTGSTVRHTSNKSIYCVELAFPPLPEQRAIAEALGDVDGLLGALDRLIAKKRDLKQATMQQLLTPPVPGGVCETRLPGFHGEWEVRMLPEVCRFRGGKAHEPYVADDGRFVCVNSKFISTGGKIRKYSTANLCSARAGDILMVMSDLPNGRALAKTFIADQNELYAVNQRVCALTPFENYCGEFLAFVLDRNPYFLKFDDGVSQTHLLNCVFQKCPLFVPPTKPEQTAIAEVLSDMDAELTALEQRREKTRALKQAMMQELLTGRTQLV